MNQKAFWEWAELQAKAMHAQSKAFAWHGVLLGIIILLLFIDIWTDC